MHQPFHKLERRDRVHASLKNPSLASMSPGFYAPSGFGWRANVGAVLR
jgi:hypothetical protein